MQLRVCKRLQPGVGPGEGIFGAVRLPRPSERAQNATSCPFSAALRKAGVLCTEPPEVPRCCGGRVDLPPAVSHGARYSFVPSGLPRGVSAPSRSITPARSSSRSTRLACAWSYSPHRSHRTLWSTAAAGARPPPTSARSTAQCPPPRGASQGTHSPAAHPTERRPARAVPRRGPGSARAVRARRLSSRTPGEPTTYRALPLHRCRSWFLVPGPWCTGEARIPVTERTTAHGPGRPRTADSARRDCPRLGGHAATSR